MSFTVRQLQAKCKEHQCNMYAAFVDLTKAFDTVDRSGLWAILSKIGCPAPFVYIIRSFHDGMRASVIENGDRSPIFEVSCGTKQGCVLAPLMFSIFFSMMLHAAFKNCNCGIQLEYRTDGDVFNIRRLQTKTKIRTALLRDLLFADDCALVAHTLSDI
jgi:Reverse transcriptase (RNA-dependent DNA polymerase)